MMMIMKCNAMITSGLSPHDGQRSAPDPAATSCNRIDKVHFFISKSTGQTQMARFETSHVTATGPPVISNADSRTSITAKGFFFQRLVLS